jgi:malate dehydrogenase (oxaloacetate-decarboxylating)
LELANVEVTPGHKGRKAKTLSLESRVLAVLDRCVQRDMCGEDVIVCDSRGTLYADRSGLAGTKAELAGITNARQVAGSITDALAGADVLIGVSGGSIPDSAVLAMAPNGIVFALANPTPEVHPEVASRHAAVVATGRSDFPNQINNVLAFPGIFRGALDARARKITEGMKVAAADAIAGVVAESLTADAIVPSPLDPRVAPAVADAVATAARRDGVCR